MMNKIKRAVIMAAGKGERLRPVTLSVPKPMIKVNNRRIIDTVIDGLVENNIKDIFIVTGYLKEKFFELKEKYPFVTLIENRLFDSCNNISSLYAARGLLEENVMIIDGDQIINDASVLRPDLERSGYAAAWTEEHTNEWLMTLSGNIVTGCSRSGGRNGWQLYGISRWTKEDAAKLKRHVEYEFDIKRNRNVYWDDIAMFIHSAEYELGICEISKNAVKEIDTLAELAAADPSYLKYVKI